MNSASMNMFASLIVIRIKPREKNFTSRFFINKGKILNIIRTEQTFKFVLIHPWVMSKQCNYNGTFLNSNTISTQVIIFIKIFSWIPLHGLDFNNFGWESIWSFTIFYSFVSAFHNGKKIQNNERKKTLFLVDSAKVYAKVFVLFFLITHTNNNFFLLV